MLTLAALEIGLAADQVSMGLVDDLLYGVPEPVPGQGQQRDRGGYPCGHSLNRSLPRDHESILAPAWDRKA